jgi:hypothetical protein
MQARNSSSTSILLANRDISAMAHAHHRYGCPGHRANARNLLLKYDGGGCRWRNLYPQRILSVRPTQQPRELLRFFSPSRSRCGVGFVQGLLQQLQHAVSKRRRTITLLSENVVFQRKISPHSRSRAAGKTCMLLRSTGPVDDASEWQMMLAEMLAEFAQPAD